MLIGFAQHIILSQASLKDVFLSEAKNPVVRKYQRLLTGFFVAWQLLRMAAFLLC